MALNIITAKFCSGATQAWASDAWQYDYGQVLQFDGVDLPEAYQVHFSNEPMTGETITQIGNADGVSVPDQFFQNGDPIFAWVYLHEGEDDGETVYMVTIPVKKRPQPSDEVPTPVEQSAIDQAIAALNIAVEKADEAITHYPTIIDGTWYVWDVAAEAYVDTGVEAQGAKGDPGADGTSPTVTVTAITGGHRVTITDASGAHTFDVLDGEDGTTPTVDPALSPTSENPVQNKVIDAALTDVMEDLNQKLDKPQTAGTNGQVLKTNGQGGQFWDDITPVITVSGTTPTINAMSGVRYICGEVSTLDVVAPESGCIDVVFTSGSTPTVLTVTSAKTGVTAIKWANDFDPTSLEANATYEINILDGEYGVSGEWT